ncbi:integrin alpha-L-like, partial [Coturnix japonica]|uniref:integrin alpha-L-like n=1 Tax=Coturnix japonica TaxID=93934 RepID=UPI0013A5EB2B
MGGPTTCLMGVLMGVVLPPTWCFQLQVTPQRILELPGTPSFGYGVLALQGGRVVVGAPAVGRLYGCGAQSGECTELQLGGNRSAAHMGMALSRHGNNTIACGPGLHMECNQNVHVGGVCAVLDPQLQPIELMEPGLQGCVPGAVDLVFLFDGSGSLSSEQFDAILDFMRDAMEQLHNSSFQFAAVQFSDSPLPLFSFRDYSQRPQPRELLRNVEQLGGLTDTFQAIDYVVDHMFSPGSGSRPWARHVILIVTDGDATDSGTVSSAERRGILRYVIGVGRNFRSARSRALLELLASSPSEHFVTVLDEFERLRGIFSQLQQRIYNIE